MAGGGMSAGPQQQAPSGDVSAGGSVSRPTGMTPPSGYRPMGDAPQFYQPVYQPQYTNYQSPFGGFGGYGGYGSPFGGFGGFGGYGGYGNPYGGFGGYGGYGGFDPRAVQANPEGFAQMMQGARQQEAQMPGSTFIGPQRRGMGMTGLGGLWSQQSRPYQNISLVHTNAMPPNMQVPSDTSQSTAAAKGGIMKLLKK